MANELDRVRISAAELRAEASNCPNIAVCAKGESGLTIFSEMLSINSLVKLKE